MHKLMNDNISVLWFQIIVRTGQLHNETFGLDEHKKLTAVPETGSTPTH